GDAGRHPRRAPAQLRGGARCRRPRAEQSRARAGVGTPLLAPPDGARRAGARPERGPPRSAPGPHPPARAAGGGDRGAARGEGPLGLRDRAMLEVLYGAGLRVSELVGLPLAAIDRRAGLLRVLGKGGRTRIVPLGEPALAALEAWLADGRPALARRRTGSSVRG